MAVNSTLSTVKNHFMRNIFKPLLFLAAFFVSAQAWGQQTAVYTVTTTTAATQSGTKPSAAGHTYSQTFGTAKQITSGNSATLTLTGYAGYRITSIVLEMRSNTSAGAGTLSVVAGSTTIASVSPTAAFNTASWNGAWSTAYVNVTKTPTAYNITTGQNVVITIAATQNSLYIQSYSITYVPSGFTVTFDPNGGSGTMANQTANTTTALNANTFTRSGYDFAGWNTAANGSGTPYAGGANFPFTANATLYAQWTLSATPSITVTETPTAFSTTYGTASAHQDFTITGSNLSANISVAALTGFEYSTNGGTSYSSTATLPATGGTLRVRLAATAAAGTYNVQSIGLASGLTTQNITTTASGNVVNQKGLTINNPPTYNNKIYDGTTTATVLSAGSPAYAGLVNGETFSVSGSGTFAFPSKNIGSQTLTGYTYAAPSGNYTVTQPTITATISAKELTISNPTTTPRPYNGSTAITVGGSLLGIVGSENVVLSTTGTAASANAGTRVVTFAISGTDAGNYTLTQPGTTVNIAKVTLTATADNKTKVQGAANPALTISYSGFVNSETVAAITAPSISTTAVTGSPLGAYPITLSGGSATNYDIVLVNGTLTVITGPCEATGFEGSTSDPSGWTNNSGYYVNDAANANSGTYYSGCNAVNDWIRIKQLTDPQSISFYARASSATANYTIVFQYSDDGTNWSDVPSGTYSANGSNTGSITATYQQYNLSLNLSGNYYIRWLMSARTGGSFFVDDVAVYCTPPAADINVLGNGVSIADATTATGVANHTEFAATPVNGSSPRTFTIQNSTGIGTINLTGTPRVTVSPTTYFSVTTQPTLSALTTGGNQSTTFVITFSPTNTLNQTATVTIVNDDPDAAEQTYTFAISGTGTNSLASDIVVTSGFTYATNINYANFTSNNITTANSVVAGGFTLRDGGATADADAVGTTLSAITFSLSNFANIQRVALYDGTTELQEVAAAASVTFNAAALATNLTTADGGTKNFTLRVTFNTSVTDNQQFQFTVTAATAAPAGSGFAAGNAGGATTSVAGNNNKIIVTADRLRFTTQPIDGAVNVSLSQFTVAAVDANFNVDVDATNSFTLTTSSGTNYTSGSPYTLSAGVKSITDVQYSAVKSNETLTAVTSPTPNVLTSATSTSFNISNTVYPSGAYLSITGSGTYTTASTWARCNNTGGCTGRVAGAGGWSAYGAGSPATPGSTAVAYVQGTVTQSGSTSINDLHVLDGGYFYSTGSGTYTVSNYLKVYEDGILHTDKNFTVATGKSFIVEDNADVYLEFDFANPTTSIWNGDEDFAPNSNLYIWNWDDGQPLFNANVTTRTYNGYRAAFGNVIIDLAGTCNMGGSWDLLGASVDTNKLAHGNLEFASPCGYDIVISRLTVASSSGIKGNLILSSNWSSARKVVVGSSSGATVFTVKGNLVVDAPGDFAVSSSGSAAGTVVLNVEGDILMNGANTTTNTELYMGTTFSSAGILKATLNLKGNLYLGSNVKIVSNASVYDNAFNFAGDGTVFQEIDVAQVVCPSGSAWRGVTFNVNSGAKVKLKNNNLVLNYGSVFNVKNGGVFDFSWAANGTTPLLITQPATPNSYVDGSVTPSVTYPNRFNCEAGGELYITSLQGIVKKYG